MADEKKQISVQLTPNPNSLQFVTGEKLADSGSYQFTSKEAAKNSRLAARLFDLEGVDSVLIGTDFVTVTKKAETDWPPLAERVVGSIQEVLASGEAVVEAGTEPQAEQPLDETGLAIKRIIDEEIRPAVARDGGDVIFDSYEDGIVKLYLHGACSTCPSSIMTLKFGIENRLRQAVPDIKEVVAL